MKSAWVLRLYIASKITARPWSQSIISLATALVISSIRPNSWDLRLIPQRPTVILLEILAGSLSWNVSYSLTTWVNFSWLPQTCVHGVERMSHENFGRDGKKWLPRTITIVDKCTAKKTGKKKTVYFDGSPEYAHRFFVSILDDSYFLDSL